MNLLADVRVLAVEDEPMLLLALRDMLDELGCEVAGTAARLDAALALAADLDFDLALLDLNLGGQRVDPVADVIAGRGLPMVFITGYSGEFVKRAPEIPVIEKPFDAADLEAAMKQALGIIRG